MQEQQQKLQLNIAIVTGSNNASNKYWRYLEEPYSIWALMGRQQELAADIPHGGDLPYKVFKCRPLSAVGYTYYTAGI